MSRQRGFTLIEMAFVVAIIGLMVGGGVIAFGPILQQAKTNQTNVAMDQIEAALVVFAIRNNRLPCPADGSQAAGSATYGTESTQTGVLGTNADLNTNNCVVTATNSVIPWRTLGLDETYSVDGWNNRISYYPAVPELNGTATGWNSLVNSSTATIVNCLNRISSTTAPPQGFRATNGNSGSACDPANTITSGTYGTYNAPTYPFGNYIAVYSIASGACSSELTQPNTNNTNSAYSGTDTCTSVTGQAGITSSNVAYDGLRAAYVLISHGTTGWYAWPKGGGAQRVPYSGTTYTLKKYNDGVVGDMAGGGSPNNGFVQGTPSPTSAQNSATYFDDIVRWRSPAFIIQNCGSGACGNP